MKKINFKQSKYVLPLILYPLILGTGYFIIGMFTTEVKSVDKNLMATNYLNSELPEAHIDEGLGSKRENMVNAFGDAKDYTAVENAERDSVKGKEEYESRYKASEAAKKYGMEGNLVAGANIAGFERVANAMMAQGLV